MGARVLLVGNGGREHAIAWKLRRSPKVDEVFVAPGNGGTGAVATNVPVQPKDIDGLCRAAKDLRIDFYLASMDDPQPLGLVDRLSEQEVLCYGPTQAAARLESSKAWAKAFMGRHGIPTAEHRTFTSYDEAYRFVEASDRPLVVKASGLAAGKGSIVCNDQHDALNALDIIMRRRDFGAAGDEVVIETRLSGWETSAHAFCDGKTAVMMPFASDYKRAQDGDIGLNTGGMGSYSPSAGVDDALAARIRREIVDPTVGAMAAEGAPYNGTLYPGLMVSPGGELNVIEYNARWGDPETQVLLPRLESDLFEVCQAAAEGRLADVDVRWSQRPAVGVVIASGGYPATYKLGHVIEGIEDVDPDVLVFHAGTKQDARGLVTNGGRVLTVVAMGDTLETARERAYENVRRIRFTDAHYRTDIGVPSAAHG
ncbi:MAG: phosphoribosylamine--glycine ligase [Hyphomicrobiales bacterium]